MRKSVRNPAKECRLYATGCVCELMCSSCRRGCRVPTLEECVCLRGGVVCPSTGHWGLSSVLPACVNICSPSAPKGIRKGHVWTGCLSTTPSSWKRRPPPTEPPVIPLGGSLGSDMNQRSSPGWWRNAGSVSLVGVQVCLVSAPTSLRSSQRKERSRREESQPQLPSAWLKGPENGKAGIISTYKGRRDKIRATGAALMSSRAPASEDRPRSPMQQILGVWSKGNVQMVWPELPNGADWILLSCDVPAAFFFVLVQNVSWWFKDAVWLPLCGLTHRKWDLGGSGRSKWVWKVKGHFITVKN